MKQKSNQYGAKHEHVLKCVEALYMGLASHDGFGDMRIEMRILKRGQKEVIIHCGKQYRFVVDCTCGSCRSEQWVPVEESIKGKNVSPQTAHHVSDFQ